MIIVRLKGDVFDSFGWSPCGHLFVCVSTQHEMEKINFEIQDFKHFRNFRLETFFSRCALSWSLGITTSDIWSTFPVANHVKRYYMTAPAERCKNNAIFMPKYTLKL